MMSTEIAVQLSIAAPAATVFGYLSDLSTHPLWNSSLMKISESGELKEGLEYSTVSQLMGRELKALNRVEKVEKNSMIKIVNRTGPLIYAIEYRLGSALADVTNLECRCKIGGYVSFFQLAAPLLEYLAQSKLEADLGTLKILIEKG